MNGASQGTDNLGSPARGAVATIVVVPYADRMTIKQRLSASVDADLLDVAQHAVAEGRAESMSAWVNDALRLKAEHDKRLAALDEFLQAYEAEHGEITDQEMADAARRARSRAVVVRGETGTGRSDSSSRRRGRGAA
jgi:Arc/MetJ-type ribon-helix-helix transcriptional regulator